MTANVPLLPEQIRRVIAKYQAGDKVCVIATEEGLCDRTVNVIARKAGLPPRPRGKRQWASNEEGAGHPRGEAERLTSGLPTAVTRHSSGGMS